METDGSREKIDTAKKWGGSTIIPLTGYVVEGNKYIIKKGMVNIDGKDRNCVVIFDLDKSIPNIRVEAVKTETFKTETKENKI